MISACMVMIMFMFGCSSSDGKDVGPSSTPFVGGETGIDMSFIEGAPPDEVFDNSQYPFSVSLKLENKGEADVSKDEAYVKITGINPNDFNKTPADMKKNLVEDLEATKKNFDGSILNGGITISEFNDLNYEPDVAGNFEGPRIRAELCYNYKTKTSTNICVKEDLLGNEGSKSICEVSEDKDPQNSGAPIHITKVTEQPMGTDKIHVSFVIEHVGDANDRFFKKGTDCADTPTNTDRYKVYVHVTSDINGVKASCTGLQEPSSDNSAGYVTLFNKAPRTVVCSFDISSASGEFEDLFTVELEYRYMQFIEKAILVKDVNV